MQFTCRLTFCLDSQIFGPTSHTYLPTYVAGPYISCHKNLLHCIFSVQYSTIVGIYEFESRGAFPKKKTKHRTNAKYGHGGHHTTRDLHTTWTMATHKGSMNYFSSMAWELMAAVLGPRNKQSKASSSSSSKNLHWLICSV